MRKVIVSEFISLDGVMENPAWTQPYWNDEIAKFKYSELFTSDALLLGRVTYDGFAAAWPSRKDEQGYADRMNNLPKYVVTRTMKAADWNNSTLIKRKVVEEIGVLKKQKGQNILTFGSAELVNFMLKHRLVDRMNLLIYPVILGKGKRLFVEGLPGGVKLVETKTFKSGVVALIYESIK